MDINSNFVDTPTKKLKNEVDNVNDQHVRVTLSYLEGNEKLSDDFIIVIRPSWAPIGAQRFMELVHENFYDNCRFFRVLPKFVAQTGINGDPAIQSIWAGKTILDDPVLPSAIVSNTRGTISFARSRKNSRTTQFYINYKDNHYLDKEGFTPIGEVIADGMDVVDKIYSEYREKPSQGKIRSSGNAYLMEEWPKLTFIESMEIVQK